MCWLCELIKGQIDDETKLPSTKTTFFFPKEMDEDLVSRMLDQRAVQYLPQMFQDVCPSVLGPFETSPDGNCLVHSVSRALFGTEKYMSLLRRLTTEEIEENWDFYISSSDSLTEADWRKALIDIGIVNRDLSLAHVFALSNVVKRPIIVYASDLLVERYGATEDGITATFVPSRFAPIDCTKTPLLIAWSGKNHFVPIITREGQPLPDIPVMPTAFAKSLQDEEVLSYLDFDEAKLKPPVVDELRKEAQLKSVLKALREENRTKLDSSLSESIESVEEGSAKFKVEKMLGPNGKYYSVFVRDDDLDLQIEHLPDGRVRFRNRVYDYVIDVEVGDGGPLRKLAFNHRDDLEHSAVKFFRREKIPFSPSSLQRICHAMTKAKTPLPALTEEADAAGLTSAFQQNAYQLGNVGKLRADFDPAKVMERLRAIDTPSPVAQKHLMCLSELCDTIKNHDSQSSSFLSDEQEAAVLAVLTIPTSLQVIPGMDLARILFLYPNPSPQFMENSFRAILNHLLLSIDPPQVHVMGLLAVNNVWGPFFDLSKHMDGLLRVLDKELRLLQTEKFRKFKPRSLPLLISILQNQSIYLSNMKEQDMVVEKLQTMFLIAKILEKEKENARVQGLLRALGILLTHDEELLYRACRLKIDGLLLTLAAEPYFKSSTMAKNILNMMELAHKRVTQQRKMRLA